MATIDKSKVRMNLSAIKKVDPYAKDIVDSSSHVAFYTFNSDHNEWEKTDVEGAFFIYCRNAQPFHSIFINNRLNTTSFVEPITGQLELQSQPPFLLYRNERSRIRGFWFYNSQECDRIGNLVGKLVQSTGSETTNIELVEAPHQKSDNVNIFKLLSKAQQEYNNSQTANNIQQNIAPGNVLKFFASAKPTTAEVPFFQRILPNTLSVEQLEQQQRATTPEKAVKQKQPLTKRFDSTIPETNAVDSFLSIFPSPQMSEADLGTTQLTKFIHSARTNSAMSSSTSDKEKCLRQLFASGPLSKLESSLVLNEPTRPALMPPTMFDKPVGSSNSALIKQEPLNQSQLVQAFLYLIQNDEGFICKLHEAYLKTLMDSPINNGNKK